MRFFFFGGGGGWGGGGGAMGVRVQQLQEQHCTCIQITSDF